MGNNGKTNIWLVFEITSTSSICSINALFYLYTHQNTKNEKSFNIFWLLRNCRKKGPVRYILIHSVIMQFDKTQIGFLLCRFFNIYIGMVHLVCVFWISNYVRFKIFRKLFPIWRWCFYKYFKFSFNLGETLCFKPNENNIDSYIFIDSCLSGLQQVNIFYSGRYVC